MKINKIRKGRLILAVLLLPFFTYSCGSDSILGRLWDQMGELFTIKKAIDDTLAQGETSIQIQNGRVMTLGLINTEYNDMEAPEREKAADEVISVLLEHIAAEQELPNLKTVIVNFIHHEKKFLIVDFNMTVDYYVYNL